MRLAPFLLAAAVTQLWGASVWAETTPALSLLQQASREADRGEHRSAIRLLEQAYEAEPAADILLEIAEQYDALLAKNADARDIRLAIVHYRLALATEKNPLQRRTLEDRLRALQERLAGQPALAAAQTPVPGPESVPLPPAPSAEREVRISFVAENSEDLFTVAVGGKACRTPCALSLIPGNYVLTTGGASGIRLPLLVPETDGVVRLPWSRRSYLPAGILLTVLGPVLAGTLWLAGLSCENACQTANLILWPVVGTAMLGTGIGLLASYGTRNPDRLDVEPDAPPVPAVRLSSFGLQPIRDGVVSSIGFSF